ncbi:MAG: HAMP domain-containing sensor histidine kinase [Pseudomonadota bacterium]
MDQRQPEAPEAAAFDAFLGCLVHDLRGPVSAVRDLSDWLHADLVALGLPLPAETRRMLTLIAPEAARAGAILQGLADFLAAGHPAPRGDVVPAAALGSVLDAHPGEIAGLATRGLRRTVRVAAEDLFGILEIAIGNAVKFHPNGHPRLWVSARHGRGSAWHLRIDDDGPGIPPDRRSAVFAPFVRAPVGEAAPGAGLGLATLARIVARYDGRATVTTSQVGGGVSLRLTLRGV